MNHNNKDRFGGNREKALERDSFKCTKCGMTREQHKHKYGRDITVDHVDNKGRNSKIKNHDLSNLQTLCLPCHSHKDIHYRLNARQIQEIKDRYKIGFLQKEIAKKFHITRTYVSLIINNKRVFNNPSTIV